MKQLLEGVYQAGKSLATANADPGHRVYNEKLLHEEGMEFRIWDAFRSKLAGALKKGLKHFPFRKGSTVLYLGASYGTTVSHLSDILGGEGEIYAVEIAPQCMHDLIELAERRENIIPIHADARKPGEYREVGGVEVIYQDVAQPDQDGIMLKNARMFLKKDGIAMIAIKSQSIDVTKPPAQVYEEVMQKLEKEFEVLEKIKLDPYDRDHLFAVLRYRGKV
ncbi:fibrillarin-like rRNA/tRNA 2'-O-methyltransferase [Candidatus Micrarchaeota archaeon]|nr:fibrillarin-like rRNA/tRNA 2'-O-methyltransferase [Candidatus Micrarchaeota archaeon]